MERPVVFLEGMAGVLPLTEMTSSLKQIVCRVGHVVEIAYAAPDEVAGAIMPCPKCGARATWRPKRKKVVTQGGDFIPTTYEIPE